jgi:uncharacterized membrane protein
MDGVVEKIVLTAIAIVILAALLGTVAQNTGTESTRHFNATGHNEAAGALENLSASAISGINLTSLVFAFIGVGLAVGAMIAAFRG